jgi:Uma2 family endonuclease
VNVPDAGAANVRAPIGTLIDVRAVMLDVPDALLAQRRRLGLDRRDEMWEGELHKVPPASEEHQRIGTVLIALLYAVAERAGLHLRHETGVFAPTTSDGSSYRVPDLVVFGEEARSERGVEGRARLVIEIRSPGDETLEKQPFWERVGVAEVVVIDRDSKEVRRWVRTGPRLVEVEPDESGRHHLRTLDVSMRSSAGGLIVAPTEAEPTTI